MFKNEVFFFHPDYFGLGGLTLSRNFSVDNDLFELEYAPFDILEYTLKDINTKEGISQYIAKLKFDHRKRIEIPIVRVRQFSQQKKDMIFMHPQTREFWFTPDEFLNLSDLGSYAKLKNEHNSMRTVINRFRTVSIDREKELKESKDRIIDLESRIGVLELRDNQNIALFENLRLSQVDAHGRINLYKGKMGSYGNLYVDSIQMIEEAGTMMVSVRNILISTMNAIGQMEEIVRTGNVPDFEKVDSAIVSIKGTVTGIQERIDGAIKRLEVIETDKTKTEPIEPPLKPIGEIPTVKERRLREEGG